MAFVYCDVCGDRFTKQGINRHKSASKCRQNVLCNRYMKEVLREAREKDMVPIGGSFSRIIARADIEVLDLPKTVTMRRSGPWNSKVIFEGHEMYCLQVKWSYRWAVEIAKRVNVKASMRYAALRYAAESADCRDHLMALLMLTTEETNKDALVQQFALNEGVLCED